MEELHDPASDGPAWGARDAKRGRLALAAFVVVQVALLAAFAWALRDPLLVSVELNDAQVWATIEGVTVHAAGSPVDDDTVALYLEGQGPTTRLQTLPSPLREVVAGLVGLDAEQGWSSIQLFDADDRLVFEHDFRRGGSGSWTDPRGLWFRDLLGDATTGWSAFLASPPTGWRGGRIEATLERGRNGAGLVLGGDGNRDGFFLLFRPVHRDLMWWQMRDGVWYGPLAGTPYLRPWHSALKDLLRLLLRPYFVALALATGLLLVRAVVQAMRRESTDEELPAPDMSAGVARAMALSLAAAAVAVTAWIADALLERMPHVQDSVAYQFQAKVLALGRLWVPLPQLPEFFVHEFVMQHDGRWFGRYPPGFSMVLVPGVWLGADWLVNPLLAGVAVLATYAVGARTASRTVGLLGAGLLLLSPFFLFLAGEFMAHNAALAFGMLFVLSYVLADRGRRGAAVLAGLALGLDFLIRPFTAALVALPFGIDLLLRLRREPRDGLTTGMLLGVGLAPAFAWWFFYNWMLAGSPFATTQEMWWATDKIGFGADKGLFGHTPLNGLYNSLRNLNELSRHAFGWPSVFTFLFALVPFVAGRSNRWDRLFLASWLSLMFGYFFWWADGVMYGPRFYLEAMGCVALLTARGVQVLGEVGQAPGRAIAAGLTAVLVIWNSVVYLPQQLPLLRGYNYTSRASIDAVERGGVHNAVVFTDPGGVYEWWNYGMVFSANSPLLDTDVVYARDLGDARNAELMALYPGRSFFRLRRTELTPIIAPITP